MVETGVTVAWNSAPRVLILPMLIVVEVNPVAGYNYQDVVVTGVVGADGKIKVSVPVGSNVSNISIGGDEFEANYTYIDFNRANKPEKLVRKETFRLIPVTISLKSGFNIVQSLTYSKK